MKCESDVGLSANRLHVMSHTVPVPSVRWKHPIHLKMSLVKRTQASASWTRIWSQSTTLCPLCTPIFLWAP